MKNIKLIEVPSEIGAGTRGASLGVEAVKIAALDFMSNFFVHFPSEKVQVENQMLFEPIHSPYAKRINGMVTMYERVSKAIYDSIKGHFFPVVLSGDHGTAGGTIAGIKMAKPKSKLGVIWIDAHADLHSPYTTPSGNIHGMPLAALMGDDHREMGRNNPLEITKHLWNNLKRLGRRNITPKIEGTDIVFIGLRSTEEEEEAIIAKENIRAFRPQEIKEIGIEEVAMQSIKHLQNCDYIYVSFDVDSLDSSISVGTGTPVEDGLSLDQATHLLRTFKALPNLVGFEITEINPSLDIDKPMHKVIAGLLMRVFE